MSTATYSYPGAPACLTDPNHICAYARANDLYTGRGISVEAWPKGGDSAAEAIARYCAHSVVHQVAAARSDDNDYVLLYPKNKGGAEPSVLCVKKAKQVIACLACAKRCVVYANDQQRPYPLVNTITGKTSSRLESDMMALVCTTCAFDVPAAEKAAAYPYINKNADAKHYNTVNSTKKYDVKNGAFFFCPKCTAHTHAGLSAAKLYAILRQEATPSFRFVVHPTPSFCFWCPAFALTPSLGAQLRR